MMRIRKLKSGMRLLAVLAIVTVVGTVQAEAKLNGLHLLVPTAVEEQGRKVLKITGAEAREQLLVDAHWEGGEVRDFTRKTSWLVKPDGVVAVEEGGRLIPLGNGRATVTATAEEGYSAELDVVVEEFDSVRPVNFPNRIAPIFTKAGCNAGGCHGKSGGQNGFRLSLLGFEPREDYEYLVKEGRGRRIFTAAPERSLLLLKGVAAIPHGGGRRLQEGSDDYRMLVRWIGQGMPYGNPDDPRVESIEVFPQQRTLPLSGDQQLKVLAHYTDGSVEDVTRSALYEANETELAEADEAGHVRVFDKPGSVAVMVRYQAQVAVFQATIPLGAPVENLPEPRNFIDELVFGKLEQVGMPPSEPCDDATFIRRATLDIAGRLPTAGESRAFLADDSADRRDRLIDRLLEGPGYAAYFANKWSALFRNKRNSDREARGTYGFHYWIRDSLMENKPYDEFVREVVAASGDMGSHPPVAWYRQVRDSKAQLEDTAQLFLGLRLQCAQCHHHPFEKWSRKDYYSFSAFFSRVGRKGGSRPGEEIVFHRRGEAQATNPKDGQPVAPAGLGAPPEAASPGEDPRQRLVDWMTAKDNPFFAKSLVNRYWKHFFGRGIVDPEDDMRETNPPTHPELLEALASDFIYSGYDLKHLIRTITRSRVYQLSALPNEYNRDDRQYFSRYYPKRLTAEVLLDAIDGVTDWETRYSGQERGARALQLPDNSYNDSVFFLKVFGRPDSSSACECERTQDASLAQSLHLLNSEGIQEKLTHKEGTAARLAADGERPDRDKVHELYLEVFSREPAEEEVKVALAHIDKILAAEIDGADEVKKRQRAYEDILFALINTKEFLFNH